MAHDPAIVRVGIGVFICKDGKILMMQRHGSHGANTWSLPGGHMEFGESFEDTTIREVKEETGLRVTNVRFGAFTNDQFVDEGKHYVTIWVLCDWESGTESIIEPDKCLAQAWYSLDDLPQPLFQPCWDNLFASEFMPRVRAAVAATRR